MPSACGPHCSTLLKQKEFAAGALHQRPASGPGIRGAPVGAGWAGLTPAAKIASQIATIETAPLNGGHWRLFRVFHLYLEARAMRDNMDRLHQYCRCIDGLIVSKQGEARKQFKSWTELFIGPRHHDMMGETYDVRSDVEHLHENKHLEVFDRTARLELVKNLEMMEYIARSALVRIVLGPKLWPHFANTSALQAVLGAR